MRYFLAIVWPPVAVLLCGKPVQFILNVFLTILGVIPGIIHALMVVSSHKADRRTDRIVRAIKQSSRPQIGLSGSRPAASPPARRASGPSFDFLDE